MRRAPDRDVWCARHREGWCATASGRTFRDTAINVATRCGHFVVLPGGCERRVPTCKDCRALPILFNAEMVRAVLAGRKTQTRRVIKPDWLRCLELSDDPNADDDREQVIARCPYGAAGERLWVRECFNVDWTDRPIYRADGGSARAAGYATEPRWKPSIHMPRWASRITLEVTDVRVERAQDITRDDIVAEGLMGVMCNRIGPDFGKELGSTREFASLWDAINAKRGFSWESNPWVFVVSFVSFKVLGGGS